MVILNLFFLLFSSALTLRKESTIYYSRIVIITLLLSSFICYNNLYVLSLEKGIGLYGGIFNVTSITQSFNIFILLISAIILIYNSFYHRTIITNENKHMSLKVFSNPLQIKSDILKNTVLGDGNDTFKMGIYRIIEYPLIILFIICGGLFLMSSGDLISIFISIELQSYGLYILSTLHRDSEQATWGGLTYFLLGGLSSCFILLGSALLYINSGTTSLDGIYIITTITDILPKTMSLSEGSAIPVLDYYYLNLSLIILSVGFLFKISAAPFHFWSPDVYDAIPTTVTTYVAIVAKISIFIFLLELVYFMNVDIFLFSWKNCLLISSLFSLIIGSVLGLTQFRIKRVYAYSTINHVGFILLALCVNSTESIQAYIFYIISYSISNLNAFIILVTIGYTLYFYVLKTDLDKGLPLNTSLHTSVNNDFNNNGFKQITNIKNTNSTLDNNKDLSIINSTSSQNTNNIYNMLSYSKTFSSLLGKNSSFKSNEFKPLKDINNSPIQLVSQLKGYFYINSYLALSLAITLFSFIGIPPLIGFFAKQMVLSAALDNGYIFITLVGILTSVVGAVYYLNIIKQIFFFNSDYMINPDIKSYNFFGALNTNEKTSQVFNSDHIKISSSLSSVISILTLILLLFIFIPNESFNLAKILSVLLFN